MASPPGLGGLALGTGPVCTSGDGLTAPSRSGRASEPLQNAIGRMWDWMAPQLRVPMSLATLTRWPVLCRGDVYLCVSVGVPTQIVIYVSVWFSLCLGVYDMWGAVKCSVPEFGLPPYYPRVSYTDRPLTSGDKGFTAPLPLSQTFV